MEGEKKRGREGRTRKGGGKLREIRGEGGKTGWERREEGRENGIGRQGE